MENHHLKVILLSSSLLYGIKILKGNPKLKDVFYDNTFLCRVIFMEDHMPIRPDRSLLLGRQTSKWSS